MRPDLRQLEADLSKARGRDTLPSFEDEEEVTAINSAPNAVKGLAVILHLLPPGARIVGLAIISALIAFAIWRGVSWAL